MNTPEVVAERIETICGSRSLPVSQLLSEANLSKSVVDRLKAGSMPSADKISAIALVLDVPVEFLLGAGVYENWDLILKHRSSVLGSISRMLDLLSPNLRSGVSDAALIWLTSAFKVSVEENADGIAGVDVGLVSPFAVNDTTPAPRLSDDALDLAAAFDELDGRGKGAVRGCLEDEQKRIEELKKKGKNPASSDERVG